MPLPKPKSGENKDNFISRCMGSGEMNSEYPEQDQRAAVCYSQWERKEEIRREAMSQFLKSDKDAKRFVEEFVVIAGLSEQLTDDDKRTILDIEADIVDLKQRLLDAMTPEEKEGINQQIEDLKQEIQDIRDAAE